MREAIIKFWPDNAGPAPKPQDFKDKSSFRSFLRGAVEAVGITQERIARHPDSWKTTEGREENRRDRGVGRALYLIVEGLDKGDEHGKAIASTFEAVAEEHLIQPTFIYDFPLAISPLSKNKREPEENAEWVERFEIFIGGLEIGNAFSELNDPEEQRRRFEQQLGERARGDEEAHQMDEDYIRALSYGLPPAAGEGVGIDRLTMLLTDSRSIRDVILFPLLRPLKREEEEELDAAEEEAKQAKP